MSSLQDERGRRDLSEFVERYEERCSTSVGSTPRTSGLLLLDERRRPGTRVAHPSFGVTKTYIAKVAGQREPGDGQRLLDGVELEDGPIAADKVRLAGVRSR